MDKVTLVTRQGLFEVGERVIPRDQLVPSGDVLIGPSLTLRKNFEIPVTADQPDKTVLYRAFSRFLPGKVDTYHCQFKQRQEESSETLDVYGMAVRNETVDELLGQRNETQELYFYENLLRNPFPGSTTRLQISLPTGTFMALMDENFIRRSDFRDQSGENSFEAPDFSDAPRSLSFPEFPLGFGSDKHVEWIETFFQCLDTDPDPKLALTGGSLDSFRSRWNQTIVFSLIVLIVTLVSWIGVKHYSNSIRSNWLRKEYKKLTGKTSHTPFTDLKKRVEELGPLNPLRTSTDPAKRLYPLVQELDRAFEDNSIHLLTMRLSRDSLGLTFLTGSLDTAEGFQSSLGAIDPVVEPSIVSSRTVPGDEFQYEIQLKATVSNP